METDLRATVTGGRGRNPEIDRFSGNEDATDEHGAASISQGDAFEVLCNPRRRRVIAYLRECGGTVTAGELAEAIAAAEEGTTVQRLSSTERKRVYVSLYQNHLPVMDDARVVDYDADRKTVRLRATGPELEAYLSDDAEGSGRRLSIGVVLVVAALVLGGGLQLGAFAGTPATVWPILGGLGLVSAATLGCCGDV